MSLKKFICCAVSIVVAITALFTTNVLVRGATDRGNGTRVALSYAATTSFPAGQTATDNDWITMINEELGFNITFDYALPTSQYETRTNTVIAEGNIPDMFQININQLSMLERAGLICEDLTDVYDTYATDLTKEKMGWDPALRQNSPNFKKWVVEGKLKAIPYVVSESDYTYVLYMRKDWLDAVGEDAPYTIDDLEIVLTKFKEAGLGKGLGINEDILFSNAGSASFVFNMFGAYPTQFVEGDNGKVDFGFFRPEMKDALRLLRNWYSKGLIYSEFATTTQDILGQKVANGEIGVWYGTMSLPLWKTSASVANIDGAEWVCLPAPQREAGVNTVIGVATSGNDSYVVKKGYNHPERLIQMMNLFMDKVYGPDGDFEKMTPIVNAYPFRTSAQYNNLYAAMAVQEAMNADRATDWFTSFAPDAMPTAPESGEMPAYFSLNSEQKFYYRNARNFLLAGVDDTGRNWAYTRIFYGYEDESGLTMLSGKKGYESAHSVIKSYYDNNAVQRTLYEGVDTVTYSRYRRTLESSVSQMLKFVIRGERDLSYFDTQIETMRKGTAGVVLDELNTMLGR